MYILGAMFIFFASMEFPGICRIQKKSVLNFLKFMAFITAYRLIMSHLIGFPEIDKNPDSPMNTLPILTTLGVYWEDAFFTLPALIAERMGLHKFFVFALLAVSAFTFATGHLAYSPLWAAITLFYIPFVSYKYGKKNGLGTVMLCHVLYDLITLVTVRYLM
jgi:membrane protease YdiL (CAAX protease family)